MSDVAEKPQAILARLPPSLIEEIEAVATDDNISRNGAVAELLQIGLKARKRSRAKGESSA